LAFSYWFDNLGFTTEGNLLLCSSYLPLGVPNWVPQHRTIKHFSDAVAREKEDFCKGSLTRILLCLCFALFYFYLHHFIENTKKLASFIVVTSLVLVHYVVP
jgi:hypothetical protein